ncbi:amidohydrolase family protein [Candidatus Amarobacter glycogenicus]|uniref:amidohydrolase family protein n=1 Tax=Candidatus Amarobacter glycogenicus TaxID=3140699 RepID=UPI0031CC8ADB
MSFDVPGGRPGGDAASWRDGVRAGRGGDECERRVWTDASVRGIIGFADLALGDAVAPILTAHIDASANRFRGIRHAAGWHASADIRNSHTNPPESLLMDAKFREGYAHLGRLGLTFEAWLYHPQIPELTDLARAFPETPIVLDHFGGPLGIGPFAGKQKEVFDEWKPAIDDLAKCPNVVAKLGGLNMPLNGFGWDKRPAPPTSQELVDATRHYYEYTIDRFGPERCMFESNFPVDKVSVSYAVLWNAFKRIAAGFREEEKDAMFYGRQHGSTGFDGRQRIACVRPAQACRRTH